MKTTDAEVAATAIIVEPRAEEIREEDPHAPKIGRWYWIGNREEGADAAGGKTYVFRVGGRKIDEFNAEADQKLKKKSERAGRWLGCVTKIGSNFVLLQGVFGDHTRVHLDEFYDKCNYEPEADAVLKGKVQESKERAFALMYKVRELTSRLAITPGRVLGSGASETQALVVRDGKRMDEYKAELARAEESELPELFKQIKEANREMERWMGAELLPMQAQADQLQPVIAAVKNRIFSVQLCAGLVEEVEEIAQGDPVGLNEPVHVIQRRAYMDEECLANYEAGGMEFADLAAFDKWLVRPDNRDRILPFPKCIIAFQVRRYRKEREAATWADFIRIGQLEKLDKLTFLYIRNGERMYRLSTEIEFDEKLFPDRDAQEIDQGKLYARVRTDSDTTKVTVEDVISENEWKGWVERRRRQERENAAALRAWKEAQKKKPKKDREDEFFFHPPHHIDHFHSPDRYEPYTRDNVHYDEIAKYIAEQIERHNRLVLVLQGLLDRSPALHPHPPWSLWQAKDFKEGLRLVYDSSRALVAGDKPDFKAYHANLAKQIVAGSVTIGQHAVWRDVEAIKEERRRGDSVGRWWEPSSDKGPGRLAVVARMRSGKCIFEWTKPKVSYQENGEQVQRKLAIAPHKLFNVSAYKPGDFRLFFSDPRTRAEYLQWAPLLLVAEDFHAGKRKAKEPARAAPKVPRPRSARSSWRYEDRKRRERFRHAAVELTCDLKLRDGTVLKKGGLYRAWPDRGGIRIDGIKPDGTKAKDGRYCINASMSYLRIRPDIPADPAHVKIEQERLKREAEEKARIAKELARAVGDDVSDNHDDDDGDSE